jgi:hypothetical protein
VLKTDLLMSVCALPGLWSGASEHVGSRLWGYVCTHGGGRAPFCRKVLLSWRHNAWGLGRYFFSSNLVWIKAELCLWMILGSGFRRYYTVQHTSFICPFGAPCVGGRTFALEYNSAVPHTFQVRNANDEVAKLPTKSILSGVIGPPLWGLYFHVGMHIDGPGSELYGVQAHKLESYKS